MSPQRLPAKLLLLVAAVLLCAAAAVTAIPAVTSVACTGGVSSWCSAGATVTFTGTELPTTGTTTVTLGMTSAQQTGVTCTGVTMTSATSLTCTLAVASGYTGSYPVVLNNTDSAATVTATYVGDVLVGAFYETDTTTLTLWSSPVTNGVLDVSEVLTGIEGDGIIDNGGSFIMYGNFSASATYQLYLYNTQSAMVANSPGLPVCSNAAALTVNTTGRKGATGATPNTLTCTSLTTATKAMGMYGYLVKNTQTNRYVYGSTTLYMISVNPPTPTVTSVTATCEDNSTRCSTGVSLTLTGTNLNLRTPVSGISYYYVTFTVDGNPNGLQSGATITCTTTSVDQTANTATISLTIGNSALPGAYPLYVVNQVCEDEMKAPAVWVGNLIVGLGRMVSTSTPWQSLTSATNSSYVAGAAPLKVITEESFALYGAFTNTTASRYAVHFVAGSGTSQTVQTGSSIPTCTDLTVTSTVLRCTYTAKGDTTYTSLAPMVYDATTGAYLQNALLLSNAYSDITFEGDKYKDKEHGPGDNPAAIAFAVIFAVLFLGMFIALIVICCCCKVINKKKFLAAGGLANGLGAAELQRYTNGQYDVDRENMNVNVVDFSTTGAANNGSPAGSPNEFNPKEPVGKL